MIKKILVLTLFIVVAFSGFYIGRATAPIVLPSYQYNAPIVFTPNSRLDKFDGYTGSQIDNALKGTDLQGLGKYFSFYAWQNNISSLYLTAHAIHESGWGTSYIAKRKNNLFGFGAYDSSPYWSADYFPSREACIEYVSGFIAKNYLWKGGLYYVSPTLKGMNKHYASDPNWSTKIASIMNYLYSQMGKPNKTEAVAENFYIQNFNKDIHGYVSKGQFIRDMYHIYAKKNYISAGTWAIDNGLIVPTHNKWWVEKIKRNEILEILNRIYALYYPYKQPPQFSTGNYYEKYNHYYCILVWKLLKEEK